EQPIDRLASNPHQPRSAVRRSFLGQPIGMPCFKDDRVDFVITKRLVLLGGRQLQHVLRTGSRPPVKFEDDVAGKIISDTARPNANPFAMQVLEIADPGIRASDDGKCLWIECDYRAELWIRAGGSKRPLSLESGQRHVGLRKSKRRVTTLEASDVAY